MNKNTIIKNNKNISIDTNINNIANNKINNMGINIIQNNILYNYNIASSPINKNININVSNIVPKKSNLSNNSIVS